MNFKYINIAFSVFIIIAIWTWLYFLLFTSQFDYIMPPSAQKKIFIGVLVVYSIFRGYRIYLKIKS
jgi:hypothetical protein